MRRESNTAGVAATQLFTHEKKDDCAASIHPNNRAKSSAQEEPASIWEEIHPDKPCLLDEMTPEEIDEFKTAMQEVEERERKLGRNSYRPQPKGMTIDDLVKRIKRKAAKGKTIAD